MLVFIYKFCGGRAGIGYADLAKFASANRHSSVCLFAAVRTLSPGFFVPRDTNKKRRQAAFFISGGRAGTRTLDPLIKSQLLYQLSYASRTINCGNYISFYRFCKYLFTTANMTQGYMPWSPCEFQSAIAGGQPCPLRQQCRFFAQPTRARHGVPTLNPYAHIPSSTHQNVE